MPFEPCFNLDKTNEASFRGSVSGLGFAYCDFTRRGTPAAGVRTTWRLRSNHPVSLEPSTTASTSKPAATSAPSATAQATE
jgi:hypothetical protein